MDRYGTVQSYDVPKPYVEDLLICPIVPLEVKVWES